MKTLFLTLFFFLGSCGFVPKDEQKAINATVSGNSPEFAQLLRSRFDSTQPSDLHITIKRVMRSKYNEAYQNNAVAIYRLMITVEFSVSRGDKLLFTDTLEGQKFINVATNMSNDTLEQDTFNAMSAELAQRILSIAHAYY